MNNTKRFISRVKKNTSCWEWIGGKTAQGYGVFRGSGFKDPRYAHRVSYEFFFGKIPKGLVLDHLCRNAICCNPLHLEAVTQRKNILRGEGATAQNAKKKFCKRGHPLSGKNLKKVKGGRSCRRCSSLWATWYYRKYKEVRPYMRYRDLRRTNYTISDEELKKELGIK